MFILLKTYVYEYNMRNKRPNITPTNPQYIRTTNGVIKPNVIVKKSNIPNAGLGLFANRSFIPNDHICWYRGELIDQAELDRRYGDNVAMYTIKVGKDAYIDAANTPHNIGRYANMANKRKDNNAKYVVSAKTKTARLVAIKNIKEGSEILVDYGSERNYFI